MYGCILVALNLALYELGYLLSGKFHFSNCALKYFCKYSKYCANNRLVCVFIFFFL